MKKLLWRLFAAVIILTLQSCSELDVTGPNLDEGKLSSDSVFTEIDTTLNIKETHEGSLTIYSIDKYKTVVIKIPEITSFLFMERPEKSLEQIGRDSSFSLVVNSSYFDVFYDDPATYTGRYFKPAGYLKIDNKVIEEVKDDRQLTCFFAYSSSEKKLEMFGINDFSKTKDYDLVTQIGPRIIRDNVIDTVDIRTSFNGMLGWPRTTFATVNGKELYVIVNLDFSYVTLLQLGELLKTSGIFRKDLNVINFDGGFSTCLYIKNHPELSTQSGDIMPLLLCVK